MLRLSLIFYLFLCFNSNAQKGEVLVLDKTTVEVAVADYLFHTTNLKFKNENELINLKNQFKKVEERVANFTNSTDENWFYFEVENEVSENQKFVLLLDQTFINRADLFLFKGDSLINRILINDKIEAINRPYSSNNFTYPVNLSPNKKYSIFLRTKANPQNGVVKSLLTLSDEQTYFKTTRRSHLLFGLLMGILLVSIIAGLILYFNSPRLIYLVYSIYILNVLTGYISNYGYLNGAFGHNHIGTGKFYHFTMMMGAFLQIHFVRLFLDLPKKISARFDKFIIFLSFYFLIVAIFTLILPNYSILPIISRSSISILILFLLGIAIWAYFQNGNGKAAKFYLTALFPGLIMTFYLLCTSLNIFPIFPQIYSILFPISTYEILIFGAGLVLIYTKEKEKVERELAQEKQEVANKVVQAQEDERMKIAQDLHDDLGSTLSLLNNLLSVKNEKLDNQLQNELNISEKAVNDLRNISHDLMPTMFLKKGLKNSIQELIEQLNSIQKTDFMASGDEKKMLIENELVIYRIIKELLNNATKHAKATKIEVQMIYFKDFLYISVEDDGVGFNFKRNFNSGIGLKNLILRVNYLDGKINQESSEKGTLISIEIPYEPNPKEEN